MRYEIKVLKAMIQTASKVILYYSFEICSILHLQGTTVSMLNNAIVLGFWLYIHMSTLLWPSKVESQKLYLLIDFGSRKRVWIIEENLVFSFSLAFQTIFEPFDTLRELA